ncbi:MAG: cytochrome c [Burkholderiales bacterium]
MRPVFALGIPTLESAMKRSCLVVGTAVMLVAGTAFAQVKPEILVKQRQAKMVLQGKYFFPLAAMAQGRTPYNADQVRLSATFLDNLSRMAWDGFDPSTKGVQQTRALPAVFEQPEKFKEAASRLEQEAHKLYEVSRSGDEAAVKAQIGAVGKTCGGCHDMFQAKQ